MSRSLTTPVPHHLQLHWRRIFAPELVVNNYKRGEPSCLAGTVQGLDRIRNPIKILSPNVRTGDVPYVRIVVGHVLPLELGDTSDAEAVGSSAIRPCELRDSAPTRISGTASILIHVTPCVGAPQRD